VRRPNGQLDTGDYNVEVPVRKALLTFNDKGAPCAIHRWMDVGWSEGQEPDNVPSRFQNGSRDLRGQFGRAVWKMEGSRGRRGRLPLWSRLCDADRSGHVAGRWARLADFSGGTYDTHFWYNRLAS
jgi:hypothetical protein